MAVNGVCLTVTSLSNRGFGVDVMPETLRSSNLGGLHYGDRVNLERAIVVGGRLGGHLVLGHVDDTAEVMSITPEDTARVVRISAPAKLMPYIVSKGFIAVDGVSLTIVDLDDFSFTVSLVTYTLEHTTLGDRRPGNIVNLETDIIAKYLRFKIRDLGFGSRQRENQGLTLDFLKEYGYVQ
jgi:riboflavin synthase